MMVAKSWFEVAIVIGELELPSLNSISDLVDRDDDDDLARENCDSDDDGERHEDWGWWWMGWVLALLFNEWQSCWLLDSFDHDADN